MNHSTGKPTKKQAARFVAMKFDGCICCRMRGFENVYPDMQHLLSGGRRRGHDYTLAWCQWHHRGVPFGDWLDHAKCREVLGPSFAEGSKPFYEAFGDAESQLEYQNARLAE